MEDEQAVPAVAVDNPDVAYRTLIDMFESTCPRPIRGDRELEAVARNLFDRTVGKITGGNWAHGARWGRQMPGEYTNDGPPRDPPEDGDHTPDGQLAFRRHIRHLGRCMGREAKFMMRNGAPLTSMLLDDAIMNVMARSYYSHCRRPVDSSDDRCAPAPGTTLTALMPMVCGELVLERRPPEPEAVAAEIVSAS